MKLGLGDDPAAPVRAPAVRTPSMPVPRPSYGGSHPLPVLHLLFAVPFLAILAWAGVFLYDMRLDAQDADSARPIFSQLRPLRLDDLSPALWDRMAARFGKPIDLRLERYRGQVQLSIYHAGQRVRHRSLAAMDLNRDVILSRYHDSTGDQADTVIVRYRRGVPFVLIYSSEDMDQ